MSDRHLRINTTTEEHKQVPTSNVNPLPVENYAEGVAVTFNNPLPVGGPTELILDSVQDSLKKLLSELRLTNELLKGILQ